MDGKLKVDEFITHRQPLANINTAFHDMHSGDCVRPHTCPSVVDVTITDDAGIIDSLCSRYEGW